MPSRREEATTATTPISTAGEARSHPPPDGRAVAPIGALMLRLIVGFHQDDAGDWVAELSCLHTQHVRHRPPFFDRTWVLDAEGRAARLGSDLDCPLCDRCELPADLRLVRT